MAKRKSLTRRLLTSTLFVLTLSSGLPGCASNEPSAVVEKTPQEQETNATRFVNALFLQETAFLEEAVDLPFFYNQQALLSYPEEWEAVISRLKAQSQPAENFSVLEVKALSGGDVLALKPNIWAKLLEYEFDQYRYFIYRFRQPLSAEMQRRDPQGRRFIEGQMLVIVDPATAKIRGFIL